MVDQFETVIGLEVHVELATESKLFCACPNQFGAPPNTQVCPVCLGLPGTLPVVNRRAVEMLVLAGRATGCAIAEFSKFDRKNYFYPDMPKNYQISQYDLPLASGGHIDLEGKRVGITRIHLEEDTGKSTHMGASGRLGGSDFTLVDYNRAGVPLLEIVSEPDMRSPDEAHDYMVALRDILRWIGVSDCKMEQGSLRCDANVSIRPPGSEKLETRTEIKNMNSFKSVRAAIASEVERQTAIRREGGRIIQETRGWDEARGVTISMRSKEEAQDYRYFPDPDLLPLTIPRERIAEVDRSLPELPAARARRYQQSFGLSGGEAGLLVQSLALSEFFEQTLARGADPKAACNWLNNEVARLAGEAGHGVEESKLTPTALAEVIAQVSGGTVSNRGGRTMVEHLFKQGGDPAALVRELGLAQVSDRDGLLVEVRAVIDEQPTAVSEYRSGKEKALNSLVGQVMKRTRGKANPELVKQLLLEALG
ncbi:Asp-tRNA(Asn)/Glu-tRNA(Gln) amidotransferase subunit GatB [bacterium CPR1]|nr:Asp-tRNA(Asn)/Glu-tRNA(Gln) amidotransferase subunit GatB [bacterium CPR1]